MSAPLDSAPAYELGWCAGTAGVIEFFIEMAATFLDTTWYAEIRRGGLRSIASQAVPVPVAPYQPAYEWPIKEGEGVLEFPVIQGKRAAGIGRAFLKCYQRRGDTEYRGPSRTRLHGDLFLELSSASPCSLA